MTYDIALIDADIFAYQAAAAAEKPTDWGDGMWTLHAFEADAIDSFDSTISQVMETTGAARATLCFSHQSNFRKRVYSPYKRNRVGVRKPMLLSFLKDYAEEHYACMAMAMLEGDDVLGYLATAPSTASSVMVTIDKDLRCIPGNHYNPKTNEFFTVSDHQADLWHMTQTLTGDVTDGYPGCPGIGPKTAEKIINSAVGEGTPWAGPEDLRAIIWAHVVRAYEKAGLSDVDALTQARVARICRFSDINPETHAPLLWEPPSSWSTYK